MASRRKAERGIVRRGSGGRMSIVLAAVGYI
jgi:hypothetical protein